MLRWSDIERQLHDAIKNFKLKRSSLRTHYYNWKWMILNINDTDPNCFEDINWVLDTKLNGYPVGLCKFAGDKFNTKTWGDNTFGIRSKVVVPLALTERVKDGTCQPVNFKPHSIIPLLAVPKPGFNKEGYPKMRLVRHAGYGKDGIATNDRIPKWWYKKKLPSSKYVMFIVWRIGIFGTMMKIDIKNAFRNMEYTYSASLFRGYYFNKQYFIDRRVIFGGREGPIYCQEMGEDIICIYYWYLDIKVFQLYLDVYVDDYFGGSGYTVGTHYLKNSLILLLSLLGLPINEKHYGPSRVLELCGIIYSMFEGLIDFSIKKNEHMIYLCLVFLFSGGGWTKTFESLKGKLRWAAIMRWPGVAFIRRMDEFEIQFKALYGEVNTYVMFPLWLIKDIIWWTLFLLIPKATKIVDILFDLSEYIEFYSDAATGDNKNVKHPGLGVYMDGNWFSIKVPIRFQLAYKKIERNYSKEMNIAHYEMLAILVGWFTFLPFIKQYDRKCIRIRCDNDIVNYALANKNSKDQFLSDCIRILCFSSAKENIRYFGLSIRSEFNTLADLLSRFEIGSFINFCRHNGYLVKPRTVNVVFPNVWNDFL